MSLPRALLRLLVSVSVLCAGQPILPSLSYPVFLLNPPDILKTHTVYHPPTQIQTHPHQALPPEPGYEVSQFHSQDELGRVVYGFHGPDQSRMESRSIDGTVRGSYSYLDPNGNIVKMQYWDDGSGFHVTGNALPNGQPAYTPEVAAARAQHLKLYQAALVAAQHFGVVSDGSDDDFADHNGNGHNNPFSDPQYDKGNSGNSLFLDDTDTVSLDNPELFGDFNYHDEETNDNEKPSVSDVEGEVELGEEVGPDEDEEEQEPQEDEGGTEEGNGETNDSTKNQNVKKGNEEKVKPLQGNQFKINNHFGKVNNEKKVLHKLNNAGKNQGSSINTQNEEDHKDNVDHDEEHHEEDNDEDHDLENHDEEDDHNDDEHEEDDHEDNDDEHEDEGEDDHNQHDNQKGNFFKSHNARLKSKYNGQHDNVDRMEHSDTETAENRKTPISQTMASATVKEAKAPAQSTKEVNKPTDRINKGEERIEDQLVEKTDVNPYVASYDPSRTFFYHYQHTIPKPIERIDAEAEADTLNYLRAQALGQASLQAQISPYMLTPAIVQPSLDAQQQQSAIVKQAVFPDPSLILQSIPSEVHDAQVSPQQNSAAYNSEKVR